MNETNKNSQTTVQWLLEEKGGDGKQIRAKGDKYTVMKGDMTWGDKHNAIYR